MWNSRATITEETSHEREKKLRTGTDRCADWWLQKKEKKSNNKLQIINQNYLKYSPTLSEFQFLPFNGVLISVIRNFLHEFRFPYKFFFGRLFLYFIQNLRTHPSNGIIFISLLNRFFRTFFNQLYILVFFFNVKLSSFIFNEY